MGGNASFIKILLYLAPVLAIIFYLISMKQDVQNVKIEKAFVQHDVLMNHMAGEMEFDEEDKSFWSDRQNKANARLAEFEKIDHEKSAKNDATMREMEKELNKIKTEDLK